MQFWDKPTGRCAVKSADRVVRRHLTESMNVKTKLSRLWATGFGPANAPELAELNRAIEPLSAAQRVERALELLPGEHVLTSSFGAQSAVMLHLVNTVAPGV